MVSIVGVGTTNSAPNIGHFAITLKPKTERDVERAEIVWRLDAATREHSRRERPFPDRAGYSDRDAQEAAHNINMC